MKKETNKLSDEQHKRIAELLFVHANKNTLIAGSAICLVARSVAAVAITYIITKGVLTLLGYKD